MAEVTLEDQCWRVLLPAEAADELGVFGRSFWKQDGDLGVQEVEALLKKWFWDIDTIPSTVVANLVTILGWSPIVGWASTSSPSRVLSVRHQKFFYPLGLAFLQAAMAKSRADLHQLGLVLLSAYQFA